MEKNPILEKLEADYPRLASCRESILAAFHLMAKCYDHDGVIYTCGNGGSCSDADHITGELLKGFCRKRPDSFKAYASVESAPQGGKILYCHSQKQEYNSIRE